MKLEDILKRLLPTTVSPKSVESLVGNFEQIGKLGASLLAIFYVVGIIIFGLYYSSLHVRSFELFKVRYIFVGFYYLAFLFLHLVYPRWWIERLWVKLLYLFILSSALIIFLNFSQIYSIYGLIWSPFPDRNFNNDMIQLSFRSIIENFALLFILLFLSTYLFSYPLKMVRSTEIKAIKIIFVLSAFSAIFLNYYIFAKFFFPNIPAAIGGGQAPFVSIVFDTGVSDEITKYFDVTITEDPYYFGRLVYMDNNSVFLQASSLGEPNVHEIRRSDILMINYGSSNEAMIAIIKVQQELLP